MMRFSLISYSRGVVPSNKFSYNPKNLCQKSPQFRKKPKKIKNNLDEKKTKLYKKRKRSEFFTKKSKLKKSKNLEKTEKFRKSRFFSIFGLKSSYTQI